MENTIPQTQGDVRPMTFSHVEVEHPGTSESADKTSTVPPPQFTAVPLGEAAPDTSDRPRPPRSRQRRRR